MVSSALPVDPTRIVHLGPTRGLTAFRASELHWQFTVTRRGSLPKQFSRKVPELFTKICSHPIRLYHFWSSKSLYQQNFFAESVFLDLDSWSRFFVWRVTHQIKLLEVLFLVECGHACPAKPKLGKTRQRSFSVIWGVQAGWYCSKQKFS